jgi:CheY-like chemotaxis protein
MTQQTPYTVATLGFTENERGALREAFRVTEHCAPSFRTLIKDARALPHIVIVNADQADAVAKFENFRRASAGKGKLSTLMWSSKGQAGSSRYTLERGASLSQLFAVLERIVAEEHGFSKADAPQSLFVLSAVAAVSTQPVVAEKAAVPAPATMSAPAAVPPPSQSASETVHISTLVIPAAVEAQPAPAEQSVSPPVDAATDSATTEPQPSAPAPQAEEIAVVLEPPAPTPAQAPARPGPSAGARFLVVDDSLPVRIQMKEALKGFAKTIDFAHSGEDAMFLIDNCKYDVIFLDVILPGKDGYEVCRYIRGHTLQRQTPVIMLTGNSSPADRVKGKLAGCDTYLIKPVRASVLAELIGTFTKSSAVA